MSDLHGCYEEFQQMLDLINFSADDSLTIIGDVVDRGTASVGLLQDIMARENARLLMGNHEYVMASTLNALPIDVASDSFMEYFCDESGELLLASPAFSDYCYWMDNGGRTTFNDYLKLPLSERTDIVNFLNNTPYYHEITVENQKYILVHSVPGGFGKDKPMGSYEPRDLLFTRIRQPERWGEGFYDDKIIVIGHTPTLYVDKEYTGKMYRNTGIVNVDCGCVYRSSGGRLCCLRLDDMREHYI